MLPIQVRPFRRADRDQLTGLVNAHVEAVLPGVSVSPNAVLSQLEREPDEHLVDPWVVERRTLVAELRDNVVGAVHLLRYGREDAVGPAYRGSGELRWLLFLPGAEGVAAADALTAAALAAMDGWAVDAVHADGALPAPGCYGIPDRWPHVAAALDRAGFAPGERVEALYVADVDALPRPSDEPPLPGLEARVALGGHATRVSAVLEDRVLGFHEVQSDLTAGGTLSRLAGWADTWELWVDADHRRRGLATWLVGRSAQRLRLAGARRLLDYVILAPESEADEGMPAFQRRLGFVELARTRRGWRRPAP
jgi:GNAT superfamily N-acetyltransferase